MAEKYLEALYSEIFRRKKQDALLTCRGTRQPNDCILGLLYIWLIQACLCLCFCLCILRFHLACNEPIYKYTV